MLPFINASPVDQGIYITYVGTRASTRPGVRVHVANRSAALAYRSSSSSFVPPRVHERTSSIDSRLASSATHYPVATSSSSCYSDSRRSSIPVHTRYAPGQHPPPTILSHAPRLSASSSVDFSAYSPAPSEEASRRGSSMLPNPAAVAPSMTIQLDGVPGVQRTLSEDSLDSHSSRSPDQPPQPRPKSPGGKLGSFFGWKSSPLKPDTESPTTTFSDHSLSPLPSPQPRRPSTSMEATTLSSRLTPPNLDIHKANAHGSVYFDNPETPILLGSPRTNAHVRELEKELSQVSSELAMSIRREMELEDELDRMRMEMPTISHSEMTRRGSDYFSDSGASSTRYPVADPDARLDQMEQKLRKAEQEKAQIKVEMAARIQEELSRRRDLEQMVHDLEEQVQHHALNAGASSDSRVSELESTLDETKRRLIQERQAKDSFGDLYSATRLELEQHKNERDNLRDEVVPQLKARIEGLEAEAADNGALMYENTRMQQELNMLREKIGLARFTSIAEEGGGGGGGGGEPATSALARSSLSRSNSLARTRSVRGSLVRSGSIKGGEGRQRSGSITGLPISVEGIKEIEDQRDALHKALKLLISRYEKQQREHARAMQKLAKSAADPPATPRMAAYHREVAVLKEEVTTLRKRTEDALEAKWQYEKGLAGLKMDLDRAEQETRSLRGLLQEHDIIANPFAGSHSSTASSSADSAEGAALKISVSRVESERDAARRCAEEYTARARSGEFGPEAAEELLASASRMEALADQLEQQVQINAQLRDRLAHAVAEGEREQAASTARIEEMQMRLAGVEEGVLAAQQHSEMTLGGCEAEVRRLEEADSKALKRLSLASSLLPSAGGEAKGAGSLLSPAWPAASAKSPRLAFPPSPSDQKTPRREETRTSLLEASRTRMLERKVRELEGLLREAEDDMQEVVQRVNRSQFEVAQLQMEKDVALAQMRKLQALVGQERERGEALMEEGR